MASIIDINTLYAMPYMIVLDNKATIVSDSIVELTGYEKTEILGKNVDRIFCNLLRLNDKIMNLEINDKHLYIFTKTLEPREVELFIRPVNDGIIVAMNEKPHSRLEEKFPYVEKLHHAEKSGIAIYSAPDLTLLRANQTYIDLLNKPYNRKENCIGKRVGEIFSGYSASDCEAIFTNLLNTGEVFYANEMMYKRADRGNTYWNSSIVPMVEDGKIKYFVENVTDVTDRVLNRKYIEEENEKLKHQAEQIRLNDSTFNNIDGERISAALCYWDITEKYKHEQEIREKKEQLEAVFETITDALIVSDKDGNILVMNSVARNSMDKLSKSGNIESDFGIIQYRDMNNNPIPLDEMPHKRAARGEKINNFKFIIIQSGREKYIDASVSPLFDADGKFIMAVMCMRDITEHKKVENSLERSNQKIHEILSSIQDDFYVLDRNWNFVYANNQFASRMSKEPNDFIGNNIWHMFPNHIGSEYEETLRAAMENRELRRFVVSGKRTDTYFKITVFPSEEGITVLATDISEQFKQQRIIEFQRKQLEVVFNNMTDAVFLFDKDRKCFYTNKAARETYPHSQFYIIGESQQAAESFTMDGIKIPLENLPACRVLQGESIRTFRFAYKMPAGTIYFDVSGSPIYDDTSGDIVSGILCFRDVTEQVKLEKAYKEQQQSLLKAEHDKNEALEKSIKMKDEFLATISHEFKTPLSVINAAVQTIEKLYENQLSDNVRKHLQRIRMNSFRQLRLVNNLLDITRYTAGYLKVNNKNVDIIFLSNAIIKSVDPYAKQKGVELIFSSDVTSKEIALDEEKYERVLLNLLSNAIKFSLKDHCIYIHISCKNRKVIITVRDEGIGIPKSKQKLIFDRFGQVDSSLSRQAEGSGIGLSLVKTLVEGMKGTITVDSDVNQGSTFSVTLPNTKLKRIEPQKDINGSIDSRIIQATAIEFSDIYLE